MDKLINNHDLELLKAILNIQSKTYNHSEMSCFVENKLKRDASAVQLSFTIDKHGNIIVSKGEAEAYACLCCHLDTVHEIVEDYEIKEDNGKFYAMSGDVATGIGGDDKCGIYSILHLLSNNDKPFKAVFFSDEEIGQQGSSKIDLSFFNDVGFLVGIDRRENSDLITFRYKTTISEDFRNFIRPISDKYAYKETDGAATDVFTIQNRLSNPISAINISCGYYNFHKQNEFIILSDLLKCIDFATEIVNEYDNKKIFYLKECINGV